jgi:hypothetical protein
VNEVGADVTMIVVNQAGAGVTTLFRRYRSSLGK